MGLRKRLERVSGSRIAKRSAAGAGSLARSLLGVTLEATRIAREMLVIPAQLFMALAEIVGGAVLALWRIVWSVLVAVFTGLRAILALARRELTPVRLLVAVTSCAIVALAASQWLDYRGISVGTGDYRAVELVAPAPEVDRQRAGDAHGWVMLPIAAACLAVVAIAVRGRWRLARLLVPLGVAVIAIAVFADAPGGLDEGTAALAYEGAEASLLEGFWAQLVAGGVIAACGLLLPLYLRPAQGRERRRPVRRRDRAQAPPSSPVSNLPIQVKGTTS